MLQTEHQLSSLNPRPPNMNMLTKKNLAQSEIELESRQKKLSLKEKQLKTRELAVRKQEEEIKEQSHHTNLLKSLVAKLEQTWMRKTKCSN